MEQSAIRALGDELHAALRSGSTLSPLTERYPGITIDDAYRVSQRLLERRTGDGERVVGKKIGATNRAVQKMFNIDQPDFGFLTDAMRYPDGATISIRRAGLIQPRAEGEIAFILARDITGPNVKGDDVLEATEAVVPCFEIVDSRITDWKIRIEDTVADNASCGVFVTGNARADPRSLNLAAARLDLFRDGQLIASGLGSAVQDHPAEAVAWLANTLARFGTSLRKGETILSGSLVPLIPVGAGDRFNLTIEGIGAASVQFTE